MDIVFLTALAVGGATVIGAILGFLFKNVSHKFQDAILGFAGGIMLCASIISLILPSMELGGKYGIILTILGIFLGAIFLNLLDKLLKKEDYTLLEDEDKGIIDFFLNTESELSSTIIINLLDILKNIEEQYPRNLKINIK